MRLHQYELTMKANEEDNLPGALSAGSPMTKLICHKIIFYQPEDGKAALPGLWLVVYTVAEHRQSQSRLQEQTLRGLQ
jgi:hypothetical protein